MKSTFPRSLVSIGFTMKKQALAKSGKDCRRLLDGVSGIKPLHLTKGDTTIMDKEKQEQLVELIITYGALKLEQGFRAGRGKEEFNVAMFHTDKAFQDIIRFIMNEC